MLLRVYGKTKKHKEWEPHCVAIHNRGNNFFGFGGERGARVFKIPSQLMTYVFFTERREILLNVGGESWFQASFVTEDNPEEHRTIFIPKAVLRPVCRAWGKGGTHNIMDMFSLPFTSIGLGDEFPESHTCVYIIVKEDDPKIVDISEMMENTSDGRSL